MNTIKNVTCIFAALLGLTSVTAHAAINASTSQFSAKLYTEGLGRLPDQDGWQHAMNYWSANTCNLNSLQGQARIILESQEFHTTSPTNHDRAFRLYRAVLHRDASAAELSSVTAQLNSGVAVDSDEFSEFDRIFQPGKPELLR